MDYKVTTFESFSDDRGDLVVFLKESQLDDAKKQFGQIYFVTFKEKGTVRGNHYHKRWHEWFGIVTGRVEVVLEDVHTKERVRLELGSDDAAYTRLEIGPNIAHRFTSLTDTAALLNYADSEWSQDDSIRYIIEG